MRFVFPVPEKQYIIHLLIIFELIIVVIIFSERKFSLLQTYNRYIFYSNAYLNSLGA